MLANTCKGSLVDSGLYTEMDSIELSLLAQSEASELIQECLLRWKFINKVKITLGMKAVFHQQHST